MTEALVLAFLEFSLPFFLETDASGVAMGVIIMQSNHPIAFISLNFCLCFDYASTYIRKLHAITSAVKKWQKYLLGHPFIILIDHKSLKELMNLSFKP